MRQLNSKPLSSARRDRRSGAALILAAISCLILVPILGLAVDGTNYYLMNSQVSMALNAAVLAGARSLTSTQTAAAQAIQASTIVQNVFAANVSNMDAAHMNFSLSQPVITDTGNHYRIVSATVTATLPLMLMEMLPGITPRNMTVSAQAQKRDVNVMLVLDHSGSMSQAGLSAIQSDVPVFLGSFHEGRDSVGLVTYTGAPYLSSAPGQTFVSNITNAVNGLAANPNSETNQASAIWMAYQQLVLLGEPGALNVIVLFTGGLSDAFAGDFTGLISSSAGCTGPTAITPPLYGAIFVNQAGVEVGGLADYLSNSLNDMPELRAPANASGCANLAPSYNISAFLNTFPAFDMNGNSTTGAGTIAPLPENTGVDVSQVDNWDVLPAAANAFDDAANRIRNDATYSPVIYTIGLNANLGGLPPDQLLLARVANDPNALAIAAGSAYYNPNQQQGLAIYTPDTAQLQQAFAAIASQVLRLSAH